MIHPAVTPHRIVPIRFARAVKGFSDSSAPDPDDHGFTVPAAFGSARGPVVAVMQGQAIRVKVIRDRFEPGAQLFPSVDDKSIAELQFPLEGNPLDAVDHPAVVVDGASKLPMLVRVIASIYMERRPVLQTQTPN